jgi:hypothetical protein
MTTNDDAQREFEPDEPVPEDELRELPRDAPAADAIDQHEAAFPEDVADEPPAEIPREASEADVLDQSRPATIDDEDR